jgi:type I restriction enzyme S subunit
MPEGWRLAPLKRALKGVNQGWSPQCENRVAEPAEWGVLKVGCVNGLTFDPTENKALPPELEPDLNFVIQKGDLLVSRANTRELVGMAAIVEHDHPNLLLCDKLYRLQLRSEWAVPTFVVHALRSEPARRQIELGASGASSSMQNISQDVLRELSMAFPPVKEQTAIANFIDEQTARIDALIAEKERLVTSLTELVKAVIHSIVTGATCTGAVAISNRYYSAVPPGWKMARVKHIAQSQDAKRVPLNSEERADRQGAYPYYGASGVIDHIDDFIFEEDRVLVGEDGANLVNRATPLAFVATGKYWVNNHAHILKPHDGLCRFWAYAIDALDIFEWVTGAAQPKLTIEALHNLPILVPPLSVRAALQRKAVWEEERIEGLRRHVTGHITRLREYRSSLISAAVTGQLDISTFKAVA